MNGLLNRLSDQSKDSIARSLKHLFDANSLNLANQQLKECTLTVCAKSDQTMVALIPVYTSIISLLHMTVSKDVGGYLIEHLVLLLMGDLSALATSTTTNPTATSVSSVSATAADPHKYINNKRLNNFMMILLYFYNFRVLHHQLILDLASHITTVMTTASKLVREICLELTVSIVEHCGSQLKKDDLQNYKAIIQTCLASCSLSSTSTTLPDDKNGTDLHDGDDSRLQYMLTILQTEVMSSGKSVRSTSTLAHPYQETVKQLRKWIGSTKIAMATSTTSMSTHGEVIGDTCLRINLTDIMDVEQRGRWWRTGSSWRQDPTARDSNNNRLTDKTSTHSTTSKSKYAGTNTNTTATTTTTTTTSTSSSNKQQSAGTLSEEDILLKLANKMKLNTPLRRKIFLVVMTSR